MKLRNKVLIAISLIWVVFVALTYVGSKYFLLQSFKRIEQAHANADLSRIDESLNENLNSLATFTSDWSHWNDVYTYMQGKNPEFVLNNLNMVAFINANVNLMTFWDRNEKLVMGASIDTVNKKITAYPLGLGRYIFPGSSIFKHQDINLGYKGYILTNDGIMMIAVCAITDGDRQKPALGTSIFGRYLNHNIVKLINEDTKANVSLILPDIINHDQYLTKMMQAAEASQTGHISAPATDNALLGYTVIHDIFGKPIGMFRMIAPRQVYVTGVNAVNYYLLSFVALGVIFSVLLLWLLRVLVIQRLERLDKQVADISLSKAIDRRVDANGNDELSFVAREINGMLDIIQASQDQLEQRVKERTEELQIEINERKAVERELTVHKEHLQRLAHFDSLTTLPNRVFFNEILNKALQFSQDNHKQLAILFIDLDRFKAINDALGHTFGDKVLKEISMRFVESLHAGDTLARLGGDEFIVLLNNVESTESVRAIAERIIHAANEPIKIETHEFFVSASVGISMYPSDGDSMELLQKNADMAMYKSKHAGGGVYNFYSPEMDLVANQHIKLESALRRAIQNNEFVLYFQPQLSMKDGKIKRVEALIRWQDPAHGLISPSLFIPLAEETGLIMQIGEWALHEACRLNRKWQDEGYDPIAIAVNISPKQFKHQDIAQVVRDALKKYRIDPEFLEVEITETAVMENVDDAITKLNKIREMGVHISMDDFGTGYTSINYLRQYPVSVLKIDQTFIKGLPHSQNDIAITTAVIALGHNLGMQIVAEGVETLEQLQFLLDQNCDLIQGYFISRPLPEEKIVLEFTRSAIEVT